MSAALHNLAPDRQRVVRDRVRALLERSEAYTRLDPSARRDLAHGLVNVVAYLADPSAGTDAPVAAGLAKTGADKLQDRLAKKQDIVQKEFKAAAGREAADVYKDMVGAMDFPQFVASLVDGVFDSIVQASIQQMEAYGELLAQVAKTVDEFARDNFTLNQGRDWLVGRFPSSLRIEVEDGNPRLAPTPSGEDDELAEVRKGLGNDDPVDLSDEASEAELARRGQLEMARIRQKQLATMVLMGIHRIVVTDGLINAKIMIDVKATDRATRKATASMHDEKQTDHTSQSGGGWFSSGSDTTRDRMRTTVSSAVDDSSEAKADVKAKLAGEVRVNFKSETFPLERLASQTQLESVNERASQ